MNNYQITPLKLYIQDIFRANQTNEKYIYEIFGLTFKNVMLHGVVTSFYNTTSTATNFELSDATGSVQVYYDLTKSNTNPSSDTMKDLIRNFGEASRFGDENLGIMSTLMDRITETKSFTFSEGSYVSIIGDIFMDDKNIRMISAFECNQTCVERDVVWLEELRYLYEKFYLWDKELILE